MLDDFHQHGGVEAGQPVVAVGQRGLEDGQALALAVRQLVQPQVPGGQLQGPGRHVDGHDAGELRLGQQVPGQHAGAAAQVADAAGPGVAEYSQDGLAALDGERLPAVRPRR